MNRIATTALGSLAALTSLGLVVPVVQAAAIEPPQPVVQRVADTGDSDDSGEPAVRWQRDAGVVEHTDEGGTVLLSGTEQQLLPQGEAPDEDGWSEVETAP